MPTEAETEDYKRVRNVYDDKLKIVQAFENQQSNAFRQYISATKAEGNVPTYTKWQDWLKDQRALQTQYDALYDDLSVAKKDLDNIKLSGNLNNVASAINDFNTWKSSTTNGTVGQNTFWTQTPGNITDAINLWKQQKFTGGGSFTVSNNSGLYTKTVVDAKASGIFDFFAIGGGGGFESVFSESSTYSLTYNYKASTTVYLNPPSVYNLDLIKQNKDNVRPGRENSKPLIGSNESAIQNVITGMIVVFGVSVDAKLDEKTYSDLKQAANGGVNFGFFKVDVNQTYSKTQWNDSGASFTAQPNEETAFIVGLHTNPYN